jgi:molybdenum cofactor guanylyltransferase
MILNDKHEKHAKLARPQLGEFNRNELAILGTTCGNIRVLANQIIQVLAARYQVAFVDADHKAPDVDQDSALVHGAALEFTDKISHRSFNYQQNFNAFENRTWFNNQDLVLVNGNHFQAQAQIAVIDPVKPLEKKLNKLTQIQLILLANGVDRVPDYLTAHLPAGAAIPVLPLSDTVAITNFIHQYLASRQPALHGLVLAGGQSQRMQTDKGSIEYFGKSQRQHVYDMLNRYCTETYISYADAATVNQHEVLPVVLDTFTGLGPFGGILSAFQSNPNAAWLTVACDLPYLSHQTLQRLIDARNTSKLATCFLNTSSQFPEPLITIWEPRAYTVMLQFLSQGYSCPRKVLINTDVELIQAPDEQEFENVNTPQQREEALRQLAARRS